MLALDPVRSVRLGVERSGVRVLALVVGVGDVSLTGFNDDIDGEAWCVCDIFGNSMTDHDSEVWEELVDCLVALLLCGVTTSYPYPCQGFSSSEHSKYSIFL